jgi:predicted dehydrogenase
MDRRTFVTTATVAAAGLSARGRSSASDPIRIGFLGVGHSHAAGKIKIVQSNPEWQFVGLWDDDPQILSLQRRNGLPIVERDRLLNDSTIRVIAVESDVADHYRHAREALLAGKHIHLEKPPSLTLAEFEELQGIAARNKLLIQLGYMWRYNPALVRAIEAAQEGWLGQVYLFRGQFNTLIDAPTRKDWARFAGGQMFEQGCHLIDLAVRALGGAPTRVSTTLRHHGPFDDTLKDNTVAVLEWPSALGIIGAAVLQPNAFAHRAVEILGTRGTAVVRPTEPPTLSIDLAQPAGPFARGMQPVSVPEYQRYAGDFAELAACVREGKPLEVTPAQDLAIHKTVLEASGML